MNPEEAVNLAEFLLARITEDEEAVRGAVHISCVEDVTDQPDAVHGVLCPGRVLAECESKRELIALADPYDFADDGGTGMSEHADKILLALAVPYADRPDYREEWRP